MKKKVAIQGIAGSYHDIAARNYFEGEEIEIIGCNTFRDVISTIKKDPSILGMMAIENTIAGSLLQNHELIRESGLQVIGEYKLRISHSLVALPGTNIHDVKEVNSHPIALMQCTDFLDTLPNAKVVEKEDTAMSARWISENQLKGHAAICGKLAAQIYNMEVLAEPHNYEIVNERICTRTDNLSEPRRHRLYDFKNPILLLLAIRHHHIAETRRE